VDNGKREEGRKSNVARKRKVSGARKRILFLAHTTCVYVREGKAPIARDNTPLHRDTRLHTINTYTHARARARVNNVHKAAVYRKNGERERERERERGGERERERERAREQVDAGIPFRSIAGSPENSIVPEERNLRKNLSRRYIEHELSKLLSMMHSLKKATF